MGKPDSSGKHLYILLALFIACTIIYYFGDLIDYFGWDTIRWDIWYTVHDPHRILFLIPILYCTYYYGLLGSLLANVSALLIFLPRALFISPYPDPALRMVIFVIFSTILSALMSLILIHRNKRRKSPDRIQTKYSTTPFALLLIFVFLSIGILIAGYLFYNNYAKNYRAQVENQLSAISDLKAGELIQWRKDRIGDANMLYRNPAFSSLVQRYVEHPDDTAARQQLQSWLYHYLYYGQYEKIMLLDNSGAERIIIPATSEPVPRDISQNAISALQSGKLTVSDLTLDDKTHLPRMELLIPVYREKDDSTPMGVVVLLIDPYRYLYPLISSWPTDSATAETLI
ncbi:MAG: hypothetical protein PHY03_06225, partial [Dehalococcoidia bacterium]|nr:hypothetical protein [Dehalococcoidia bacterium]